MGKLICKQFYATHPYFGLRHMGIQKWEVFYDKYNKNRLDPLLTSLMDEIVFGILFIMMAKV